MITRSIIGSTFETRVTGTQAVGSHEAVTSTLAGRFWLYGLSQVGLDPTVRFPLGLTLSDTRGEAQSG